MKVLILCTGNSCRSQMAEGLLRNISKGKLEVFSAGIETHGVNPRAIEAMRRRGLDIKSHTSNNISEYKNESFDYVITVCDHAKETCPFFPATKKMIHHNFSDPADATGAEEEILKEFERVRDEIEEYLTDFYKNEILAG